MESKILGPIGAVSMLFLSSACGGPKDATTGAGGAPSSTSTATTTTSATTTVSTGSGDDCAAFADAASTHTITLNIHNERPDLIYLSLNCRALDYTIEPLGGPDGTSYPYQEDKACLFVDQADVDQTCHGLQSEKACDPSYSASSGGQPCGPDHSSQELFPGYTYTAQWTGLGLRKTQMPLSCWKMPGADTSCNQVVAAPAGLYRMIVRGYTACTNEGQYGCSCIKEGWCMAPVTGDVIDSKPVTINFPLDKDVDVVFGP
jgi:hypothetical protein